MESRSALINFRKREKPASTSASPANLVVSSLQQQLQLKVEAKRISGGEMGIWGVILESEFGFEQDCEQDWECYDIYKKREKSASVSGSSADLVLSPYFQSQPQLSHGSEVIINSQMSNERKRLPKGKANVKTRPIVKAGGNLVSPYFEKGNRGEREGSEIIIKSQLSNERKRLPKGKTNVKTRPIVTADGKLVSPYFQKENRGEGDCSEIIIESEMSNKRKRLPKDKGNVKGRPIVTADGKLVSPYFLTDNQDEGDGSEMIIKSEMRNKRKRLPKGKGNVKTRPIVTADGKLVSPYFRKENRSEGEGQGLMGIMVRNNKVQMKAKTQAPNNKRLVSPYFPHGENDTVVASKSETKAFRHFQGEGDGCMGIMVCNNKGETKAKAQAPNNEMLVSPYFPHEENDTVMTSKSETKAARHFQVEDDGEGDGRMGINVMVCNNKVETKAKAKTTEKLVSPYSAHGDNGTVGASKPKTKASRHFEAQQDQSSLHSKKKKGDDASMEKKRRVSPYFPHGIDDIVVVSKPTLKKKKEKNDAYLRKSPENAWIPPKSVHGLLQEEYYADPWKVLVICILLNKTTGTQARKVIQDFFELCPNAEAATMVDINEIKKVICTLGLQNQRSEKIQKLSKQYLRDDWTHVEDLHGIGKYEISLNILFSTPLSVAILRCCRGSIMIPSKMILLHRYASDAYAIFCTGKWKDVVPKDHKLVPYWEDLWKSEKTGNGCKDKSMDPESS